MVINISRKPNQVNLSDNNVKISILQWRSLLMWFFFHDWLDLIYCLWKSVKTEREYWYHIYCQRWNQHSVERKFLERKIFFENSNKIWNNHMVNWSNFTEKNKKKVSCHDIPNESKFIMKSGCLSKQKKHFSIYFITIPLKCAVLFPFVPQLIQIVNFKEFCIVMR